MEILKNIIMIKAPNKMTEIKMKNTEIKANPKYYQII